MNMTDFDTLITDMNSTDRLSTSIVDEKDRSLCFNHRDELDSADTNRSWRHGTRTVLLHVCMLYIASMHAIYSASLAWDYVSQGNA